MKRKTKTTVGILVILILPAVLLFLPISPLSVWGDDIDYQDFKYNGEGIFESYRGIRFYESGGTKIRFSAEDQLSLRESEYDPDEDETNFNIWKVLYEKYNINNPKLGWYDSCSDSGECEEGTVCMSSLDEEEKEFLSNSGWERIEPHTECEDTQYEKQFEGGYYKSKMSSQDKDLLLKGAECSITVSDFRIENPENLEFNTIKGKVFVKDPYSHRTTVVCEVTLPENSGDIDCNPAPNDDCMAEFNFDLDEKYRMDSDSDGIYDRNDACPHTYGEAPNGCPKPKPQKPIWKGIIDSIINWFKKIGLFG